MIKHTQVNERLALIRIRPPFSIAETEQMVAAVKQHATVTQKAVYCTDLRSTTAMAPDVIERIIAMMSQDNPFVVRNAILYTRGSSVGLQMLRALKAAQSGDRRKAFDDSGPLMHWLGEVLADDEKKRVEDFLWRDWEG